VAAQASVAASPRAWPPSVPGLPCGNAIHRRAHPPLTSSARSASPPTSATAPRSDAALAQTVAALGPVTILVNNAGGVFHSSILDTSENGWDALYKANLRHVLLCTQRVARGLVEAGLPGSIISVTSIEGVRAAPGYAAYAAAKAGVINYTKTAALELAPTTSG
jgi:NAD(P)-dependent dehydrogenase (short-subunit alcohol dehydrogenase family)